MAASMNINTLVPIGVGFVVIAFVLAMGSIILNDLYDDQTADSYAQNATEEGLEALEELASWLPTLALVVVAAIIIGILLYYLASRR